MMNKVTESLVNLGLLKTEYVTADREPAELEAFNQVDAEQRLEIIVGAETIITNGLYGVRQSPESPNADTTNVAHLAASQAFRNTEHEYRGAV